MFSIRGFLSRLFLLTIISVGLILQVGGGAWAADGGFEVIFSISKQKAAVGDELVIAADITHDENFKIEDLPAKLKMSPFTLKRAERVAPKKAKGVVADGFRVTVTIFDVGKFTVPRIPIHFKDPKGKSGVVYTDAWPVEVFSVLGNQKDTGDIRPLKGPESLETDAEKRHRLLILLAALLAALSAGLLTWWAWRRWESWREARKTPRQRAIEALARLEKKALLHGGQAKAHYAELTDILKTYVIREFGTGSLEHTTREFVAALQMIPADARGTGTADQAKEILDAADLVKFARAVPTADESRCASEKIQKFVTETSSDGAPPAAKRKKRA